MEKLTVFPVVLHVLEPTGGVTNTFQAHKCKLGVEQFKFYVIACNRCIRNLKIMTS
jgi:hypothetical protein